jgi:hypothetical protein
MAGALMLAAPLAPRAEADVIVYFNFEADEVNPPFPSVPAPGPGGLYPFLQVQSIINSPTNPLQRLRNPQGAGTTLNQLAGDVPTSNSALDAAGNTGGVGPLMCFRFGANTTGNAQASLSFALQSISPTGSQFTQMEVRYSTNGGTTFTVTPEGLVTIIRDGAYHVYTFNISGAGNTPNALIEVCFTGSTGNSSNNHTFIDNIQINASVPEPATTVGGVLGVIGLCWCQRRRLVRAFLPRRSCKKAGRCT